MTSFTDKPVYNYEVNFGTKQEWSFQTGDFLEEVQFDNTLERGMHLLKEAEEEEEEEEEE